MSWEESDTHGATIGELVREIAFLSQQLSSQTGAKERLKSARKGNKVHEIEDYGT
jgi:hypothetical protein